MERFLLFDSNCSRCSQLARSIEETSNGWLGVRSLREESIQSLLNEISPGWKWKPTLVELQGEERRIFTGIRLNVHLLRGLGPRKTWKVFQTIYRANLPPQSSQPANLGRRYLWKRASAVLAGMGLGLGLGNFVLEPQAFAASSPNNTKMIRLSSEELQRIAQYPSVLQSNSNLGTHHWVEGYHFEKDDGLKGYVLVHEPAKDSQMFVGLSEPTSTGRTSSIAGRIVKKDQDTVEIHWFATSGQALATTTVQGNGAISTSAVSANVVTPDFSCNLRCFALCINQPGVTLSCLLACGFCILGNYVDCAVCVFCAGVLGVGCAIQCCHF